LGNLEQQGNPLALAVETSGRTGSAALGTGDQILAHDILSGHLRHGAELFTCCRGLLDRAGGRPSAIEHIYISAGPGSFTGIRIAVTMAKTLSFANNAKIVSISTMDVLSANADAYISMTGRQIQQLATILDAKRGQFFVAVFRRHGDRWVKTVSDCLMTCDAFLDRFARGAETIWLAGEGLVYYKHDFTAPKVSFLDEEYWFPSAINVYKLAMEQAKSGNFSDPLTLAPAYIRGAGATPKAL
jgi:tRNA threonylcarbamoyladenosine biosynthesis protein TsaB